MTRFRLALLGCWRRPLRTSVSAAGVAIAVSTVFSLLAFQHGYQRGLRRELERLGGHILIAPKGCPYEAASLALHGANWPCYLKASYLREIRAVSGISAVAPVFMSAVYQTDSRPTIFVGIDTNMLTLKPAWRVQGNFPQNNEILLGAEVGRQKNWDIGRSVELPGMQHVRASVVGILNFTHSTDDNFVYLPLRQAQEIFRHSNELTHVLIKLSDPSEMDNVAKALRGCDAGLQMNVVPLAHIFRSIQSLVLSTRWFLGCATMAAVLAAAAGVSATLLIAVNERAREIGVMRALGASRTDVFCVIWLEALQVCGAGAVSGILLSFVGVHQLENWLRTRLPFVPAGQLVVWEWWIVGICLLLALILGSLAAFLPARRAACLTPIDAMRRRNSYA